MAEASSDIQHDDRMRRLVACVLAVLAYSLYYAGHNIARRDLGIDGSMLYVARFVQIAAFIVVAVLYRNHLPNVRRLLTCGSALLGAHLAVDVVSRAVLGLPPTAATFLLSSILSGLANAVFLLLVAHAFSTFGARTGCVVVSTAFLAKELLFAWSAVWPTEVVYAGEMILRFIGVTALILFAVRRGGVEATSEDHPMQYGLALEGTRGERPLAYLVSGADWAFQVIAAAVLPFIFGFMSQALSTGALSDGLHDVTSEIAAIMALAVVLAASVARGERFAFTDLLVPTVLLYTLGLSFLAVLPTDYRFCPLALLKCAGVVNESMLWILLARKAFEDPRHTYLYFGVFLSVWNVSYGRLLEPLVLGWERQDQATLTAVSCVFLGVLVLLCLALFVLEHTGLIASPKISANETEDAFEGARSQPESPDALFVRRVEELCEQARLTPREQEVLVEMLHGYSMPNAAQRLGISAGTVRTHMRNIYQKTGTSNKQELVAKIDSGGPLS